MIGHHTLQSCGYEFGLGLWRQSSADQANNLQCKPIVFIEECHHVDRGIRANKPWWFIDYHSSRRWRRRQQAGFHPLPKTQGYAASRQGIFSVCCYCVPSSRPHRTVIDWPVSNAVCTAGDVCPARAHPHHAARGGPQHRGHRKHSRALLHGCCRHAWEHSTRMQTCFQ